MKEPTVRKGKGRIIKLPLRDADRPVREQIKAHLRQLIASGAISGGARMPAQRVLARDMKVSRNTVIAAYDDLCSEELLESRRGAGTFVVAKPHNVVRERIRGVAEKGAELPLHQGVPNLDLFPIEVWRRLQEKRWRKLPDNALGYGDAAGWPGLRLLLAQRLAATRGLKCDVGQVFIVSSAAAALRLACLALHARGSKVWVEDPGYKRTFSTLGLAGAEIVPIGVDEQGLVVERGREFAPFAQLAVVTPAAQFPTGAPMSKQRRRALLDWAESAGAWIIEDDYDADFAFEREAPPALASERRNARVLHVSTLNSLMFPALQIAAIAVPEALVSRFQATLHALQGSTNTPAQIVAADFIESGQLATHLRRCREVFGERRAALRGALTSRLGGHVRLAPQPVGLHVTAWLPAGQDDCQVERDAATDGLVVHSLNSCSLNSDAHRPGIYMGFANYSPAVIEQAVAKLARVVEARFVQR